jgi:uncharacterized protein (DUF58 family)
LEDGKVEIRLSQPIYGWLLFITVVLFGFFPIRLMAIPMLTLLGILVIGYLWSRNLAFSVKAIRKLRYAAVQVGDEMEELITIQNTGWLPVWWIAVEDESDFPGYSIGVVRSVGAASKAEWRVNLICQKRGVFQLGPWRWVSSDPFGIFTVQRCYESAQTMVVYPPMAVLSKANIQHGKQSGDLRPLNLPILAESIQATQTRSYQPGDPLRRIHWRTSARRETLYVKTFDPDAVSRVWLVPDFDLNVHNSTDHWEEEWENSTEETVILLVSALASQLINEHRAVGLYTGIDSAQMVMPQRGAAQMWNILAALAPLHAAQSLPFKETLSHTVRLISPNDLIIAITPSISIDWVYTLAQISRSHRGSEAWAFLLDRESFGLDGNPNAISGVAKTMGINTRIVHKGEVKVIPGSMGALRKWEYITTGTGKAVVRNRPRFAEELDGHKLGTGL